MNPFARVKGDETLFTDPPRVFMPLTYKLRIVI